MKYLSKIKSISFLLLLILTTSCEKVLDEQNRSNITPDVFSTPYGLQAGLAGCYSNFRYLFGQESQLYVSEAGTDELRRGDGASTQMFFNNIQTSDGDVANLWNRAYQSINTLNGVIAKSPDAAMPAATKTVLVAEAKFVRAYYYFMLVQTFGEVSLQLSFNTSPSVAASRQPISEVYAAIIKDLY
jgi:starch-binding outer membrane protein, SusD/RagB family